MESGLRHRPPCCASLCPLTPPHFLPVPRSSSPDVIPVHWSSAPRLTDPLLGRRGLLWALANTPPPPQPVLPRRWPWEGPGGRRWDVGAESFHQRPPGALQVSNKCRGNQPMSAQVDDSTALSLNKRCLILRHTDAYQNSSHSREAGTIFFPPRHQASFT